jgi:hypothetical protein
VNPKTVNIYFSVLCFCETFYGAFPFPNLQTRFREYWNINQNSAPMTVLVKVIGLWFLRICDILIEVVTAWTLSSSVNKWSTHHAGGNENPSTFTDLSCTVLKEIPSSCTRFRVSWNSFSASNDKMLWSTWSSRGFPAKYTWAFCHESSDPFKTLDSVPTITESAVTVGNEF